MAMMISKFHKIIQSKVVWGVFAVLICVAFVGVSVPGSKSRSAARQQQQAAEVAGRLFGEDVSRLEFWNTYRSVYLNQTLQYGRQLPDTAEVREILVESAWVRLAMLRKARQMGIDVTNQQTVNWIQAQPMFQNPQTGGFDARVYTAALQQIEALTGMSAKEVENYYAEELLLRKVIRLPIQGALVTNEDIRKAFHLYTDKVTAEYTVLPRSLADTPDVTDADAKAYYELNMEQFRLPEKVRVNYVQFPVADHLEGNEVSDEVVARFYESNKQRFMVQPADDAAGAQPEYQPLEEVKDSIAEQLQLVLARKAAADLADELVAELADEEVTFEAAAQRQGLEIIRNTPPFALTESVRNVDSSAPFQRAAFTLKDDRNHYYSDPVIGNDYVYVITLVKRLDSFIPDFDVVHEDALESARLVAAERAYIEKVEEVRTTIDDALNAGNSFADALAAYKLKPTVTEPFDAASGIEDEFGDQIIFAAVQCEQGELTDLIATPDEYLLAYIAERIPGDEAGTLPAMRDQIADSLGTEKSMKLIAAWQESLLTEAEFEDYLANPKDPS